MRPSIEFCLISTLPVDAAVFWVNNTIAGVNAELKPLRLTAPREWLDRPLAAWPVATRLFQSWILLFGVLPVDRHTFGIAATSEHGFVESSVSLLNRIWRHERYTESTEDGLRLFDHVVVECRFRWMARLSGPIYKAVFRHRHRRLRKLNPPDRGLGVSNCQIRDRMQAMIVTFRPAGDADKPFLTWLEEACMRAYAVALWGRWRPRPDDHFTLDGHRILVADGKDVGCVAALRCSDHLDVDKLYVAPGYQNRGIGSAALNCVLSEARELGICVRLIVLRTNPALAFYLRHGFRVLEETDERWLLST